MGSITVNGFRGVNGGSGSNAGVRTAREGRARRQRLLSVPTILDAALALIDEHGRLTMAELATRLGSSASSIYHHLPGRTAILEGVREQITAELVVPWTSEDWTVGITGWLRRYRDAFARHPHVIPLLTGQTITTTAVLAGYEQVAGALRAVGFADRDVVLWLSLLDSFALGSALDLAAPDDVWRPDTGAGDTPALDAVVAAGPRGRARADAAFELGVSALLAGMRAHLDAALDNG